MTCKGNCTLCGLSRDSACHCLDRSGKVNDPVDECLEIAAFYIDTERFFGRVKRENAYNLIALAYQESLVKCSLGQIDGFRLRRIDRDCERLRKRADGKVFATAQMMAESQQSTATQTRIEREHANRALDGLLARRAKSTAPQAE